MRVKVDTGAQGNVLPRRVFSGLFPEYKDNNIPKVSVLEQYNNTKLTAYNGTSIPHYGTKTLKCWKKDCLFVCFVGLFHIGNWNFWLVMA